MWSDKARAGYLRQVTATDAHAPGGYRAYAAAQHEPGFYKAFGIRKGDPMWLDPKDRVRIW
jgi:putative endopeptidase